MKIAIAAVNIYLKDAIGNFCYDLADVYRKNNHEVDLYSEASDQNGCVSHYEKLFSNPDQYDLIFYHHSIYEPNLDKILKLPTKKIVYFHGITPPDLLRKFEPVTADYCEKGLGQLSALSKFDLICVNSLSSAKQLEKDIPALNPVVIPPIVSTRVAFQSIQGKSKKTDQKTLLSVGRVVPHKKIEDTILLFNAFLKKYPHINLTLKIIGTFPETQYHHDIFNLIEELGIKEKIIFDGFVSDEALVEAYENADCYVLMSEHEGFGVPLFETLKANIPILAYNKNAIGEVLGDAGCQVLEKDPEKSADLLHQILTDDTYQQKLLAAQELRFKELMAACDESVFIKLIK